MKKQTRSKERKRPALAAEVTRYVSLMSRGVCLHCDHWAILTQGACAACRGIRRAA
jgi:hypothetical protein